MEEVNYSNLGNGNVENTPINISNVNNNINGSNNKESINKPPSQITSVKSETEIPSPIICGDCIVGTEVIPPISCGEI